MHLSYSLVMPIHNQAAILPGILTNLKENTVGDYEIIFILDGCTDTSEATVRAFSFNCPVTIIVNQLGLFETSCDNQGFKAARGEFIIEIQADMEMTTYGYNELLCRPLRVFPDLIAVSGRCCHTLRGPESGVGKLGRLVEHPHRRYPPNTIYLSHTVNRGPLALRRAMVEELGWLDEEHYVLGDDEHDLFARAWAQKKWRTAFFPVEFNAPLAWGSTRKQRPAHVQAYLNQRRAKEKDGFLTRATSFPPPETRSLV
jgi:glycosyltransferase involved in cell wall biosynthesis